MMPNDVKTETLFRMLPHLAVLLLLVGIAYWVAKALSYCILRLFQSKPDYDNRQTLINIIGVPLLIALGWVVWGYCDLIATPLWVQIVSGAASLVALFIGLIILAEARLLGPNS